MTRVQAPPGATVPAGSQARTPPPWGSGKVTEHFGIVVSVQPVCNAGLQVIVLPSTVLPPVPPRPPVPPDPARPPVPPVPPLELPQPIQRTEATAATNIRTRIKPSLNNPQPKSALSYDGNRAPVKQVTKENEGWL